MPAKVKASLPESHYMDNLPMLQAATVDSVVSALANISDFFQLGVTIAAAATAIEDLTTDEDYLNGGYNACEAAFGGFYNIKTAIETFCTEAGWCT